MTLLNLKRFYAVTAYRDYLHRTRRRKYRREVEEAIKQLLAEEEEPAAWRSTKY